MYGLQNGSGVQEISSKDERVHGRVDGVYPSRGNKPIVIIMVILIKSDPCEQLRGELELTSSAPGGGPHTRIDREAAGRPEMCSLGQPSCSTQQMSVHSRYMQYKAMKAG